MLSPRLTFAGLIAASSLVCSALAAEPANLAYKWPLNQTIAYRIAQDSNQSIAGMPMPNATQTIHQVSTLGLTARQVADDGTATIEAVYQSIILDMQPMFDPTKYSFDSANPGDDAKNPLAGPVKAVVGQTFTVILGPDGAIRKVEGFQAIADKAGLAADPSATKVTPLLKNTFSEQSVTKFFEVAFHRFPGTPVEPGGTWTTTYDSAMPQIGTMSATGQSTLTSIEAGAAVIDTTVALSLKPPAPGEPVNPVIRGMKLENAGGQANSLFDAERGLLRRFSGKVSMPFVSAAQPGKAQQMNISFTLESSTDVELLEPK